MSALVRHNTLETLRTYLIGRLWIAMQAAMGHVYENKRTK